MADTHVISALKKKRAEIAGFIEHLNRELDTARAEIVQIEGALRIFGYERPASDIPPKKYAVANLFKRNEATKFIFDQLRTAPDGLLTSEIAERYVISKGWDWRDKQLVFRVKHRIGSVLSKHGRKGELVAVIGVKEDEKNFKNKIGRGKFTAAFMLATLEAIGATSVTIES